MKDNNALTTLMKAPKGLFSGLFLTGLIISTSANANAAQTDTYLVQYRSPSLVKKAAQDFELSLESMSARGTQNTPFIRIAGQSLQVSGVLKNSRMVEVQATAEEMKALLQSPDVAFVEKEYFFPAPTPLATKKSRTSTSVSSSAELPNTDDLVDEGEITWGLKAVRAVEAWNLVRDNRDVLAGRGTRVLVIDTGVDRDHSDLKTRFEAGRDFLTRTSQLVLGLEDSSLLNTLRGAVSVFNDGAEGNSDTDYDYYDQNGHGTHVAGTVLGAYNGSGVSGVAPLAHLLAGRVCGQFGCSSAGIVRAIEYGVEQGVDVINMSLGGPMPSQATKEAIDAADAANTVVVAASGNDGEGRVSFPAAFENSLAVGALDARLAKAEFSNWGPELGIVAPGVDVRSAVPTGSGRESIVSLEGSIDGIVKSTSFVGSEENTTPRAAELVHVGLGRTEDFADLDLTGKFALIQRGEIYFSEKVKNALAAKAEGVLIYNNVAGLISGSLSEDGESVGIPVAMIEQTVGETIAASLKAGNSEKAAIGVNIVDHAAFNGTSMASPHVAGVAALVKAVNPDLTAAEIRSLLKSTAVAMEANEERPNEYGAGLVDAKAAVQAALDMQSEDIESLR